jgi:hypothetical protein
VFDSAVTVTALLIAIVGVLTVDVSESAAESVRFCSNFETLVTVPETSVDVFCNVETVTDAPTVLVGATGADVFDKLVRVI